MLWTSGKKYQPYPYGKEADLEKAILQVEADLFGPLPNCQRVMAMLERLRASHGLPDLITVGQDSEVTLRALDEWDHRRGVKLDFTRAGKPTDNAYIESTNGRFRLECLNSTRLRP